MEPDGAPRAEVRGSECLRGGDGVGVAARATSRLSAIHVGCVGTALQYLGSTYFYIYDLGIALLFILSGPENEQYDPGPDTDIMTYRMRYDSIRKF